MTEVQTLVGEIVSPGEWTPEYAASHITEAWQNAVESIVETGRRLAEAKAKVGHGNWLPTVQLLPFGERTARALMQIADHPDLANRQHVADLPAAWGTLAVLAQLPAGEIPRRIEAGEISPEINRAAAQELVSTYAIARQEALNAWNQANDGLTAALSYAKTYTPPDDTDIYASVDDFIRRLDELSTIARTWKDSK